MICDSRFHIYLVDYRLGAKTGLDLIKDAIKNGCEEPIILLTGKGNKEVDVLAMEAGAADYLVKAELNTEKLERCIRYAVGRYEFIKALKSNEKKFRNIFEKSKDAVFVANGELAFLDVNPATSEIFEYSKDELLQLNFYDLLSDKNDEGVIREQLNLQKEVDNKEVELITKTKEKITGIISISNELDDQGMPYVQGIIHDITNRKKSEKASLQTEKLRATERLVRTLAHEVRNPLNNINLSIEQLESEYTQEGTKIYIDIINRNSKRIGDLITELLDSSRPTDIILERISLQTVIDYAIASAIDRINLKKIKLERHYSNNTVYVMADMEKLKIALLNIIINAVEAMEENEGTLSISLNTNNHQHSIYIRDNGSGLSEENISRLFEPYFTLKRNGLGLGLAYTLNILQSHKALVDVKSQQGKGTTFILSFDEIK